MSNSKRKIAVPAQLPSGRTSEPSFLTLHALRIKGFAPVETAAQIAGLPSSDVEEHLKDLQARELAKYREARKLWQLTPAGREAHAEALQQDTSGADLREALHLDYAAFLTLNDEFKGLCTDWQLRNGEPNDHSDKSHDESVVSRLVAVDEGVRPVVSVMSTHLLRLGTYVPRLQRACELVVRGEHKMFTGVMCDSYHDIWMELHEDLLLTQGIERAQEGSF